MAELTSGAESEDSKSQGKILNSETAGRTWGWILSTLVSFPSVERRGFLSRWPRLMRGIGVFLGNIFFGEGARALFGSMDNTQVWGCTCWRGARREWEYIRGLFFSCFGPSFFFFEEAKKEGGKEGRDGRKRNEM